MATSLPLAQPRPATADRLFHRSGLAYLWVWNDRLDRTHYLRQIEAFARAGVTAVCFHPRSGLEVPYLSDDWFDMVRWCALRCAEHGLAVWLYDEDPCPSGGGGGWVMGKQPEFYATQVVEHVAEEHLKPGDNFVFPMGRLLWCGLVDQQADQTQELTSNVGVYRTRWQVMDPWDSRYYYPDTPHHDCPRAWTYDERLAIRVPDIPEGSRLVAYVQQRVCGEHEVWVGFPDTLNPDATQSFMSLVYDQYARKVGDLFGSTIQAVYTDEPKIHSPTAWTPGLAEAFTRRFGYDLTQHLRHLFGVATSRARMQTLLDYRTWCMDRFDHAWMQPVRDWCDRHGLHLVGHLSPEDDPIQQAHCLGDAMRWQKKLTVPGTDIIIPAVGDRDHPVLNVGTVMAVSAAQQNDQPGAFSESMACSGTTVPDKLPRKIFTWQSVMGITTPTVHAAWSSMEGNRAIEAPPNLGPTNPDNWQGMTRLGHDLADLQKHTRDARQLAPVAMLWPMRTFQAMNYDWQADEDGLRATLWSLLAQLLDRQVGVHLINEDGVSAAALTPPDPTLSLGKAKYQHVVLPPCRLLSETTVQRLDAFIQQGGGVHTLAPGPSLQWVEQRLQPLAADWPEYQSIHELVGQLPRLIDLEGATTDVRCTAWQRGEQTRYFLLNLNDHDVDLHLSGQPTILQANELRTGPKPQALI